MTYIVEEPIAAPLVIAASAGERRNVISFGDYKASKTVELDTANRRSKEQRYAAI